MVATTPLREPKLRVHSASGQAYIYYLGKRIYLGAHGKPETLQHYHQTVAEILASGGTPLDAGQTLTIKELISRFWVWAEDYYTIDGVQSPEIARFHRTFKVLTKMYADTPVDELGPRSLLAVRQKMITLGWCRTSVNKQAQLVKTLFRWGTENELVSGETYHALTAVAGLRRGRCQAPETDPVRPVPIEHVDAIKPHVSSQVWALIQLQILTGARGGEIIGLRPCDINHEEEVWTYMPVQHKTAHHGHRRIIYFGPRAQEVLRPFLANREAEKPLFSPAEAEEERRRKAHAERVTPLSCGMRMGAGGVADRIAKASEQTARNTKKILDEVEDMDGPEFD